MKRVRKGACVVVDSRLSERCHLPPPPVSEGGLGVFCSALQGNSIVNRESEIDIQLGYWVLEL